MQQLNDRWFTPNSTPSTYTQRKGQGNYRKTLSSQINKKKFKNTCKCNLHFPRVLKVLHHQTELSCLAPTSFKTKGFAHQNYSKSPLYKTYWVVLILDSQNLPIFIKNPQIIIFWNKTPESFKFWTFNFCEDLISNNLKGCHGLIWNKKLSNFKQLKNLVSNFKI